MKSIAAFLIVSSEHKEILLEQIGNLRSFDRVFLFINGFDETFTIDMISHSNVTFLRSLESVSQDEAYRRLLDVCDADYFTLLSFNHFHHGEIYKYIKTEGEKDYDLLYVDEGYIENEGKENQVVYYYHKPDFDLELLYSQNYIARGAFFKTAIAKSFNAFSNDLFANSDWEFTLSYIEKIDKSKILHIPVPLIAIKNDALSNSRNTFIEKDPEETAKFVSLLRKHIEKTNRTASITIANHTYPQICFAPLDRPKVCIVIPTKDKLEFLSPCIESILQKTTYDNYEILIVDNRSEEPATYQYFQEIQKNPKVKVVKYTDEFDFAKIHNTVANYLTTKGDVDFMCLLNNDTLVINGLWLEDMVGVASDPSVGAVGAKLLYQDNTIQHAGVVVGIRGLANHLYHSESVNHDGYWNGLRAHRNCTASTGACLLVRLQHFLRVNGMWEMLPVAYNDVDLCLNLFKQNLRIVWSPNALLYHYESKSRGSELDKEHPEKLLRFARDHVYMRYRHGKLLENDPFYNQNFDVNHVNYQIGTCSAFRQKYGNSEYLLNAPYSLDFVDACWLPMPTASKFTFALRLPKNTKGILKGMVIPYHQQELPNVPFVTHFHAGIKFPNDPTLYEIDASSTNGKNVRFDFKGFERSIEDLESFVITLFVKTTTSSLHLKWFYTDNNYSMAFEAMSGRQFRVIFIIQE